MRGDVFTGFNIGLPFVEAAHFGRIICAGGQQNDGEKQEYENRPAHLLLVKLPFVKPDIAEAKPQVQAEKVF